MFGWEVRWQLFMPSSPAWSRSFMKEEILLCSNYWTLLEDIPAEGIKLKK